MCLGNQFLLIYRGRKYSQALSIVKLAKTAE